MVFSNDVKERKPTKSNYSLNTSDIVKLLKWKLEDLVDTLQSCKLLSTLSLYL